VTERRDRLDDVQAGDIIRGRKRSGRPLLLLVYEADDAVIRTRRVTTGETFDFDRDGQCRQHSDNERCIITSTATLPPADYQVALGLDRKMRAAKELTDLALSEAEIDLLQKVDAYFEARPLPKA